MMPKLPAQSRRMSFGEVDTGLSREMADAEAQRCLNCGTCSECGECVRVCEADAVRLFETPSALELNVAAIVGDGEFACGISEALGLLGPGASAGRPARPRVAERFPALLSASGSTRLGVLVCECAGNLSRIVDTNAVVDSIRDLPGVVHAAAIRYACTEEASHEIEEIIVSAGLNRLVLASCACCTFDRVCTSCSPQRLRNKLGLFERLGLPRDRVEPVNIREQCAWMHPDSPGKATLKAQALVGMAVARVHAASIALSPGTYLTQPAVGLPDPNRCRACGACVEVCEFDAARLVYLPKRLDATGAPVAAVDSGLDRAATVDSELCTGCGTCIAVCETGAMDMQPFSRGQIAASLRHAGKVGTHPLVIGFACQWGGYGAIEAAAVAGSSYASDVYWVSVPCAGRLDAATLLQAFEAGADGVLVAHCDPEACHYRFGAQHSSGDLAKAREILSLLGIAPHRIEVITAASSLSGRSFALKVDKFIESVSP